MELIYFLQIAAARIPARSMTTIPSFEKVAIIGDNPRLTAEISSLFVRPRRYLTTMRGPHLHRPDWTNEIIRRHNALNMAQSRKVLLANMRLDQNRSMLEGQPEGRFFSVKSRDEAQLILKGWTRPPTEIMDWGSGNLAIGLLLARRSKKLLATTDAQSPPENFIAKGIHLLIICEKGKDHAEIAASNLAFATDASFLMIPELSENIRTAWLEELYALGSGGDTSRRFSIIRDRVRERLNEVTKELPNFEFRHYKQLVFFTNELPWGIAVPECPTTHMFAFPDCGRTVVEGLWAASHAEYSARTALLIQPDENLGSEMESLREALVNNRTLVRHQIGPLATVSNVRMLFEAVPFDIIVLSNHAGDIAGQRITYSYTDSEGLPRRLITDEAVEFEYDPKSDKFFVETFYRFHELDGIDWTDSVAKAKLNVGTAITTWSAMDTLERAKYRIVIEEIPRVNGSMGLKMHDRVWIPALHGFPPDCTPIVFNNACASWHRLSTVFMFAGARAYIGTLFPVIEFEAQEMASSFFNVEVNTPFPKALWESQNRVYQGQDRRPYVMVGLPFCSIQRSTVRPGYLSNYYSRAIREYDRMAEMTPYRELRENYLRTKDFLIKESQTFGTWIETSFATIRQNQADE